MPTPTKTRLAAALREIAAKSGPINAAKYEAFAKRAETGEFDATKDESDAWAYSQSGQEAFKSLPPAMRIALFGEDPVIPEVKH